MAMKENMIKVNVMQLKDTRDMMVSTDYKERFKAEYLQTKIRYEKLKNFNTKIEAARRTGGTQKPFEMPKHDCPDGLLLEQQRAMESYLHTLEVRAVIEGIDLMDYTENYHDDRQISIFDDEQ